jgi:hypothetical protein
VDVRTPPTPLRCRPMLRHAAKTQFPSTRVGAGVLEVQRVGLTLLQIIRLHHVKPQSHRGAGKSLNSVSVAQQLFQHLPRRMSTAFHGKWLFCMLIDYWLIYRSDEPAPAALEAPGTAVSGHITGEDSSTELPSTHDRDAVYPHWYVRGAVYLVAFLHTRHHVTFRACTLILKCLEHVFTSLPGNLLRGTADMPTTLHTVFARLKARDRFTIHPVCYNCHKVFQPGIASVPTAT